MVRLPIRTASLVCQGAPLVHQGRRDPEDPMMSGESARDPEFVTGYAHDLTTGRFGVAEVAATAKETPISSSGKCSESSSLSVRRLRMRRVASMRLRTPPNILGLTISGRVLPVRSCEDAWRFFVVCQPRAFFGPRGRPLFRSFSRQQQGYQPQQAEKAHVRSAPATIPALVVSFFDLPQIGIDMFSGVALRTMSILMNFGSESFHQDELLANEKDVIRARKSAVRITSGVFSSIRSTAVLIMSTRRGERFEASKKNVKIARRLSVIGQKSFVTSHH